MDTGLRERHSADAQRNPCCSRAEPSHWGGGRPQSTFHRPGCQEQSLAQIMPQYYSFFLKPEPQKFPRQPPKSKHYPRQGRERNVLSFGHNKEVWQAAQNRGSCTRMAPEESLQGWLSPYLHTALLAGTPPPLSLLGGREILKTWGPQD